MDSQMSGSVAGPTQSMMPDFDNFPDSNFSATMDEPAEDMIVDSQPGETQGVQLNLSQSQMHGLGTLMVNGLQTQISEMIEPSQDAGMQQHTPLRDRFVEPPFSTVETMVAEKNHEHMPQESPLVRKGRLRRRMDMSIAETVIPEASEPSTGGTPVNAFMSMKDSSKKEKSKNLRLTENFDHKKSKAKEMVQEQAEESEDEYAGLGGADGEDSDNESNGSVEEMIDDAAGNDNDERKIAAFYAYVS
jgi:mediator of replication checkpoint protein 1